MTNNPTTTHTKAVEAAARAYADEMNRIPPGQGATNHLDCLRAALTAAKAAEDQPHDGLEQLAQFTSAKVRGLTAQVAKLTARAEHAESEADLLDKSLADVGRKLAEAVKEIRAQTIEECAKVAEQQTETYHEDRSAVDVRLSTTHGPKWQDGPAIAKAIRSLSTSPPPPPSEWLPIESAPKDGTCVLIALKNPIPDSKKRLRVWEGRQFVARHPGIDGDGFDAGWSFAAPVGCGGFPDEWIAGWKPLESPPPAEGGER